MVNSPGRFIGRLLFLVCVLLSAWILLHSRTGYCWYTVMHREITRVALENCPAELRTALSPYKEEILWNSMAPDIVLQDWPHHEWNVHRGPGDKTDAPDYISHLSNNLIFYLRAPNCEMGKAAQVFGLISHYIADINQPLHTDDYLHDNAGIHLAYEIDVDRNLADLVYRPVGFSFWGDIRKGAAATAFHANLYYAAIMEEYMSGRGFEGVSRITGLCYRHAVSDIIDLWSTIYFSARAVEPVHLAAKINEPEFVPGEMLRISVTSIVTYSCLRGDLYVELKGRNGAKMYLEANGTLVSMKVPYRKAWRPLTRAGGLYISVPIAPEMAGRDFDVSVFMAACDSDPDLPGSILSNTASAGFHVLPVPASITSDISDEPYLFVGRSYPSGQSRGVLLHRWDILFLGEKRDNPLTKEDESLLNRLIPGKFRHVMLYLGRDRLGRPATIEYHGSNGLVLARLPETTTPYKSFYGRFPVSIKDVFAYQNRKAKRLNPIDLGLVEEHESELLKQIDLDFASRLPYQFEYSWSGDFSDKAVHLVDDGRANGVSCTDYILDLFETNATVCIHGARMKAKEVEDYFLYDPDGMNAVVPDKWNPFPFPVTCKDILEMGFYLVNPPPHLFPCDNSTEIGVPVPARLVDSPDLVDIEGVYPVFSPK